MNQFLKNHQLNIIQKTSKVDGHLRVVVNAKRFITKHKISFFCLRQHNTAVSYSASLYNDLKTEGYLTQENITYNNIQG